MEIILYTCVSEPVVVDKFIAEVATLEGYLRNETSVTSPSIRIEGEFPADANYAYIPDFNRYYYIEDIEHYRNEIWFLSLVCDVLMSFKQGIRNSQVIVNETATTPAGGNKYLSNDAFVSTVKTKTDILNFPSGFDSAPEFILITAGGFVT